MDLGRKSVVVGLALKKHGQEGVGVSENEKAVFHGIMGLVKDMLKRNPGT